MGPFLVAWLVGMGLNIGHSTYNYRILSGETSNTGPVQITNSGPNALPPKPGKLLIASGVYVGLAILAEADSLRSTATLAAWGYNVAIGLAWAQDAASAKNLKMSVNHKATWSPPKVNDNVLFPTGTANPTKGVPSSNPTGSAPGAPGTLVA